VSLVDLEAAFQQSPNLQQFSKDNWERTHDFMLSQGFASENFVKIVSAHPALLGTPVNRLHDRLECWRTLQFGEYYTIQLLTTYPEFFAVANKTDVNLKIATLSDYVGTRKKAYKILMNSPTIVQDKVALIEAKIQYLRDSMKVDPAEVVHCGVFSLPLAKIRLRHEILVRLGSYKPKSAKADEHEKSGNAKLSQIFDTSDKTFAKKVAFITLEEYEVFEQLLSRELERKAKQGGDKGDYVDEEVDDDSSDGISKS
jgi:mTERF domain-containing protein, mitochondrial